MLITIANIIYPILALLAMLMLVHKKKSAFLVFLFVEIIMIYIGVASGQYGIAIMAVIYFFTNIYGYNQWSKE